jgi:ABC-type lipoprotein release transport system permease subunit
MEAAGLIGDVGRGHLLAIAAGVSTIMLVAFAAASTPVWRAVRIEPAAALREE